MNVLYALAIGLSCSVGAMPPQISFTTVERGAQSRIQAPRNAVVRTASEWQALWREHGSAGAPPRVDLKRSMVVGVFLGMRPTAGYAVEITQIERREAELIVTFRERRPAPDEMSAQVLTAPFHIVRTALHAGPVRFQRMP